MKRVVVKHLKTWSEKREGMLRMKTPEPVFFCTRFGIHTFGMHFPIDVLILDDDWNVRSVVCSLKPNRVWLWNPFYKNVLELPEGWIEKNNVSIGDIIHLVYR